MPKYLPLVTYAYNPFNTPNLGNYSPYELTFGRKPILRYQVHFKSIKTHLIKG